MQKDNFVFMFLIFIYFRKTAHCCVPWNLQNSVPGGHGTVLPSCSRPVELPGAGYWVLTGKEFYKTLSIIGAYPKQSQQNDLPVILIERGPPNDREDLIEREPAIRISPFSVHQLGCNLSLCHSEIPCINVPVYQKFYFIVFIPLLQRRRGNY